MAVALLRPGSTLATVNPVAASLILAAAGSTFVIKLWGVDTDDFSPDEESTGAEDPHPVHELSGYLYSDLVITGAMVASSALGLQNIVGTTVNYASSAYGTQVALTWNLSADRRQVRKGIVRRIRVSWRKTRRIVPVTIFFRGSGMSVADVAALEASY